MPTYHDVVCPGCGCVCDDLVLEVEARELRSISPMCRLAENWFEQHWDPTFVHPTVNAQPADLATAIGRAAEILSTADYPLIYGLSRAATSGQRAAVALAEKLGAVVDSTASMCHGPSIMALQEVGEVTSTLGEVRNRADLVIFWGCDPATSHPRHAERYSVFPNGRWVERGRSDRTIVMVGDAQRVERWNFDAAGSMPDLIVPIEPGQDFEAINCLRAMLSGSWSGPSPSGLGELLELMKACRYGVVFFGLGLPKTNMWQAHGPTSASGHVDVAALLELVAELNQFTRFTARRMRIQGDVSGADNVLLWQTSYPFGVDFSRGFPRYNPGETTTGELLERGEVDACLLLGAETLEFFSERARRYLATIPLILIDYPNAECPLSPEVQITTAVHGIHAGGTIYRMDNVPLSLRPLLESTLPTDEQVLQGIMQNCEYAQNCED